VSVADAGSDLLQVNGTATIANGARVDVTLGNVQLVETTKTILTSEGAQPANLFLIDEDFAFFDSEVVFLDTNDIGIHLTPNGDTPATLAQTPNQRAVAMALEQALAAPHEPDLDTVSAAINGLQGEELPQALADMSGEQLTEFATARLAISDRFQSSLHERIRGVAWRDGEGLISQRESESGVFASNPLVGRMLPGIGQAAGPWPIAVAGQSMSSILDSSDAFSPAPGELGVGGWIDGYGLLGTLEGDSGTADLDYLIGGVSLGMDYRFHPNWLIGIAGGYAHTELDFDELSGNQSAETGQGAVYLGYVTPWLQIGGSGRFGYSAMTTTRDIDFISRDTDADFDGFDGGARVDAALDLFEIRGVELQPLASISYTHVQQDEIDESGADTLDLTGDEEEVDSIVSGLGGRVHGVLEIGQDLWLHPELRARWNHEFGDTERELSSVRIGGQPGAVFEVSGAEFPSDTGVIGVSWTLVAAGRLHAFIDYDVTLASELIQHGVAVGAKFVW
jgi:outer membrane autotransporter protein